MKPGEGDTPPQAPPGKTFQEKVKVEPPPLLGGLSSVPWPRCPRPAPSSATCSQSLKEEQEVRPTPVPMGALPRRRPETKSKLLSQRPQWDRPQ